MLLENVEMLSGTAGAYQAGCSMAGCQWGRPGLVADAAGAGPAQRWSHHRQRVSEDGRPLSCSAHYWLPFAPLHCLVG